MQQNWLELFDSVQFCYNIQKSSITKTSLFELILGTQPQTPIEIFVQKYDEKSPATYRFAMEKQELFKQANDSLWNARKKDNELCWPETKTAGIKWEWQGVTQIKSIDLEENYGEVKASRADAEIWWTFQNDGKTEIVAYRLKLPKQLL